MLKIADLDLYMALYYVTSSRKILYPEYQTFEDFLTSS
jgi:hypothetical protein